MGASKVLGILSIIFSGIMPLFGIGVILGIIGLCLKKEKGKETRDIVLNTIGISIGVIAWIVFIALLGSILA